MTKSIELTLLPPNLVITLKRFDYIKGVQEKIFDFVEIYDHLNFEDIFRHKIPHPKYMLVAVVVHIGKTTESGHYFTYIRDSTDPNQWIALNDSIAYLMEKEVDISSMLKKYDEDTPYMLFYQRE